MNGLLCNSLNRRIAISLSVSIIIGLVYYLGIIFFGHVSHSTTLVVVVIFLLSLFTTGWISFAYLTRVNNYFNAVSELTELLAAGDLCRTPVIQSEGGADKIFASIYSTFVNLDRALKFTHDIGAGKFSNAEYRLASDDDALGKALVGMRNKLIEINAREKDQQWLTEGLAKFGAILRSNTDSVDKLCNVIIGDLVKYVAANQGAIYLLMDEVDEPYLKLISCYAYERKKYVERRIEIGEGILGQAFLEKDKILMTNVPKNYVKITSGLGEALPNCIFIAPLKCNGEVLGVLELASFNNVDSIQAEFVEKIAESIASTIVNIKVSEKTRALLVQSQSQAEELKSAEEELRQNIEEMASIQEDMKRKHIELEKSQEEITAKNLEIIEVTKREKARTDTLLAAQKKTMEHLVAKMKQEQEQLKEALEQKEHMLTAISKN